MILSTPFPIEHSSPGHQHELHEFIICHDSLALLHMDDRAHRFSKGKTLFIRAGAHHHFELNTARPARATMICFDDTMLHQLLPAEAGTELLASAPGSDEQLQAAVFSAQQNLAFARQIETISQTKPPYHQQMLSNLISVLLLGHISEEQLQQQTLPTTQTHSIQHAIGWIEQSLDGEISIDRAAAEANMSRAVFTRSFRKATGMSLTEYVNCKRVESAAGLLVQSTLAVTDIAYQVGFNHIGHFYKCFQKQFAMTPKQFKQMFHS